MKPTKDTKKLLRDNLKFIVLLVSFFVLIGLVYSINQVPSEEVEVLEGEVTVVLGEDGFDPDYIVVKQGTKVTFKTDTGESFWVASNNHPDHLAFPEFDPKEAIAPDESWSFVFDRVGVWPYHDHLKAFLGGVVVVLGEGGGQIDIVKCRDFSNLSEVEKEECFVNFGFNILAYMDVDSGFEALNHFYTLDDSAVSRDCHNHMHILGDVAYRDYERTGTLKDANWPQEVIHMCSSGFLHGFLEHYIKESDSVESVTDICYEITDQYDLPDSYVLGNCYHGIGHGYTDEPEVGSQQYGDDKAIARIAVSRCDETFKSEQDKRSCFSGTFNTLAYWRSSESFGLELDLSDPFALCEDQSIEAARSECYQMQVMQIGNYFNWDPVIFIERYGYDLEDVLLEKMLNIIVEGSVEDQLFGQDYQKYLEYCDALRGDLKMQCIVSVVGGFMSGGQVGQEYVPALKFCQLDGLNFQEKNSCYNKLVRRMELIYDQSKIDDIYEEFGEDFYEGYCI